MAATSNMHLAFHFTMVTNNMAELGMAPFSNTLLCYMSMKH